MHAISHYSKVLYLDSLAGLKAKDIMGYCLMLLMITGVIISVGLTFL